MASNSGILTRPLQLRDVTLNLIEVEERLLQALNDGTDISSELRRLADESRRVPLPTGGQIFNMAQEKFVFTVVRLSNAIIKSDSGGCIFRKFIEVVIYELDNPMLDVMLSKLESPSACYLFKTQTYTVRVELLAALALRIIALSNKDSLRITITLARLINIIARNTSDGDADLHIFSELVINQLDLSVLKSILLTLKSPIISSIVDEISIEFVAYLAHRAIELGDSNSEYAVVTAANFIRVKHNKATSLTSVKLLLSHCKSSVWVTSLLLKGLVSNLVLMRAVDLANESMENEVLSCLAEFGLAILPWDTALGLIIVACTREWLQASCLVVWGQCHHSKREIMAEIYRRTATDREQHRVLLPELAGEKGAQNLHSVLKSADQLAKEYPEKLPHIAQDTLMTDHLYWRIVLTAWFIFEDVSSIDELEQAPFETYRMYGEENGSVATTDSYMSDEEVYTELMPPDCEPDSCTTPTMAEAAAVDVAARRPRRMILRRQCCCCTDSSAEPKKSCHEADGAKRALPLALDASAKAKKSAEARVNIQRARRIQLRRSKRGRTRISPLIGSKKKETLLRAKKKRFVMLPRLRSEKKSQVKSASRQSTRKAAQNASLGIMQCIYSTWGDFQFEGTDYKPPVLRLVPWPKGFSSAVAN